MRTLSVKNEREKLPKFDKEFIGLGKFSVCSGTLFVYLINSG